MLPNTALAVFLPSRGAVIHKHIFSYNSSADDPVIADLVWRQLRSDRGASAAITVSSCECLLPATLMPGIVRFLCGFCWGFWLGQAPRAVGFVLFKESQCLIRQIPWHSLAEGEPGLSPSILPKRGSDLMCRPFPALGADG